MGLRHIKLWHLLGAGQLLLVVYLMLATITIQVEVPRFSDKLVHWFIFVVLMSWYMQLFTTRRNRLFVVLLIGVLGVGLEYLQGLNPHRQFDYADMAANLVGVVSGIALVTFARLRYLYWIETWLAKEKGE